jgi:NAD(P)-dependent dehydrogenase (short-subunit alcohol dehydrogenase family)
MSDDFFLRNRSTIAIITGATQGLGLAIAGRLAREGAPGMVISGRNTEKVNGLPRSSTRSARIVYGRRRDFQEVFLIQPRTAGF